MQKRKNLKQKAGKYIVTFNQELYEVGQDTKREEENHTKCTSANGHFVLK